MTELVRASFDFFKKEYMHRTSLVDKELYQVYVDIPQDCIELWERYYRLYDKQWWLNVYYNKQGAQVSACICGDDFDDIDLTDLLSVKFIRLVYEYINWNKEEKESEENNMNTITNKGKAFFTAEHLRQICIKNNWFTGGDNTQYDKLFRMNEDNVSTLHDMAVVIYICSDTDLQTIENTLNYEFKLVRIKAEFDPIRLLAERCTGFFNFRKDEDNAFDFYLTDEIVGTIHRCKETGKVVVDGFKYTDDMGQEHDLY